MIAQLKGLIIVQDLSYLVLDVGGVGYQVFASGRRTVPAGWYRGRGNHPDRACGARGCNDFVWFCPGSRTRFIFGLLQTVQGVGAKAPLSILTVLEPDQLAQVILAGDKAMVARADGIGPKLAQRIVNELAQKTGALACTGLASGQMGQGRLRPRKIAVKNAVMQDALSALVNLGYSRTEAFTALQKSQEGADSSDVSGLIAAALKQLGR